MHAAPLLPLGRVDRRQDQVVVVQCRGAGLVAGRRRRVERDLGQEALARRIGRCDPAAAAPSRPAARAHRRRSGANAARTSASPRRCRPASSPWLHGARRTGPARRSNRRRQAAGMRKSPIAVTGSGALSIASSSFAAVAGPTPGSRRAMRKPDIRLRGLSAQRSTHSTSLTCAASRNLSPPYLTNGMSRRASSSSSCALWLELRNSTACDLSVIPHSRCSSTLVGDAARLIGFVANADQLRLLRRPALGPQVLAVALAGQRDDRVRGVEDRLRRPVVAVQRDDACGRVERVREVEDVAHRRRTKRIDRLRVVADDGHARRRRA